LSESYVSQISRKFQLKILLGGEMKFGFDHQAADRNSSEKVDRLRGCIFAPEPLFRQFLAVMN
jgi:hypothetical protein